MQTNNPTHTLAVTSRGVQHITTGLDDARINTEKAQLTNKRISCNLEGQRSQRLVIIGFTEQLFLRILWIDSFDWRNIQR